MHSQFALLILFSFFVALVFAVIVKDEPKAQLRFGAIVLGALVAAAILFGWLMYPFPL